MIFERVLEEDIFSVLPYGAPFLSGAEITKARRSTEGAGRQSDFVWVREAGRSDPESRRGRMALALRKDSAYGGGFDPRSRRADFPVLCLGKVRGGRMATPEIYHLQFYRHDPGDLGITDLHHSDPGTLEAMLRSALLSLHNNETIAHEQRPDRARAITADGFSVISEIEVTGHGTVRRI